ncbi:MAG TPA: hypothetical protein VIF37_20395 [Methylobacter sp.]|jgi:hypothetical protein
MNQQAQSKAVQYWAIKHLVVSGKQCRLTDNDTPKNLFRFDAGLVSQAIEKGYPLLRFGRAA